MVPGSSWSSLGASSGHLGALLSRLSTISGAPGAFLVAHRVDLEGSWGGAGLILGSFESPRANFLETSRRHEAKTDKSLKVMTLQCDLLYC